MKGKPRQLTLFGESCNCSNFAKQTDGTKKNIIDEAINNLKNIVSETKRTIELLESLKIK
jgi:hypothetical protein